MMKVKTKQIEFLSCEGIFVISFMIKFFFQTWN